jgi:hypothetical protein
VVLLGKDGAGQRDDCKYHESRLQAETSHETRSSSEMDHSGTRY